MSDFRIILHGLGTTVQISLAGLLLGTILGGVLCAMNLSRLKVLRIPAKTFIAVLRGNPVLMIMMLLYFVVFANIRINAVYVAVLAFGLNSGAHIAEIMRSSILAVDKGQVEAARSMGFSKIGAFTLVTLPQAGQIAKPVYQSAVINIIQWTSVVGYITITDLTRVLNNIGNRSANPFFAMAMGMVIYMGLSYVVYGLFSIKFRRKIR